METITYFEFGILDFIYQNIRCDFLDPIMAAVSYFASKGIGWIILSLVLLIPKKTRTAGAIALIAMLIGFLSGELLIKNLVCRLRPYAAYEAFHGVPLPFSLNAGAESGFSFPSGHTCCSFAAAIAYFKINRTVGFATLAAAVIIGFSRLYNYVHFPTDVLAGALLGAVCALVTLLIFKKLNLENKLNKIGSRA